MERHAALIDASALRGISLDDCTAVLEAAYAHIGGTSKHNWFLLADLDFNDAPVHRLTADEGCKKKQSQMGRTRNPKKSVTNAFQNIHTCTHSSGLQVLLSAQVTTGEWQGQVWMLAVWITWSVLPRRMALQVLLSYVTYSTCCNMTPLRKCQVSHQQQHLYMLLRRSQPNITSSKTFISLMH